ncbi:type I restriction endonuclease subunit R [Helicobacter suis]|uniref:type I restriction endonuclease subunit R n=1 Tax=Helicobacter suis TaxID=104628 RepID=UPI0013D2FE97|nr:HsdR family type I site-specific deoxyribonuclease [Helicobacter suis]
MAEKDFEEHFIQVLQEHGYEEVLEWPKLEDIKRNWQKILYTNNKDRLKSPLNDSEMDKLLGQIRNKTPYEVYNMLEGGSMVLNQGATNQYLKIFDTNGGLGNTYYQIAKQPWFGDDQANKKRGDLSLLINGLPLVHIELKKEGVSWREAFKQIKDYAKEGVFKGLFACIQLFICATPEQIVYFPNFGDAKDFNEEFCLYWADSKNNTIHDYRDFIKSFLSVDSIHTFLSHYMVPDSSVQSLKAMRPYQCYAVQAVLKSARENQGNKGGYVWHTTGSGKTLTSFKSAVLLLRQKQATKVVFLADRRELVLQTFHEYKKADTTNVVKDTTRSTKDLEEALGENGEAVVIATLQRMSKIKYHKKFDKHRFIFIIDEAHRSTFGNIRNIEENSLGMLKTIQENFSKALFIGFTGTPKVDKTSKLSTEDIFGEELHRYTLADGMKDEMVLGFDVNFVNTMPNLRQDIANLKAQKGKKQEKWMDKKEISHQDLEAEIPPEWFNQDHKKQVVGYILKNYERLSNKQTFHAIFATFNISDALEYYQIFQKEQHPYKITAIFDPSENTTIDKKAGIEEILKDYNRYFEHDFSFEKYATFQKDVAQRLAHSEPYLHLEKEQNLDLVIVVDQMLTGFDSKWVNTLYLDKILEGANLIQALSRTNRIFGPDKPFGNIIFLRKYATMKDNLQQAVTMYADGEGVNILESKPPQKVQEMNTLNARITTLLKQDKELKDPNNQKEFLKDFKQLYTTVRSAQIQGFKWDQKQYNLSDAEQSLLKEPQKPVILELDEETFKMYLQKYKSIVDSLEKRKREKGIEEPGFEIDYSIIEQDEGMRIDFEYVKKLLLEKNQEKLDRYIQTLPPQEREPFREFLQHHLPQNWQEVGLKACYDQFKKLKQDEKLQEVVQVLGVDIELLRKCVEECQKLPKKEPSWSKSFGKFLSSALFDKLEKSADKQRAKAYFESKEGRELSENDVINAIWAFLKDFLEKQP